MPFSGTFEDRLAIRELLDTYVDAVNQRDPKLWGSTWANDSSWKLPAIPGLEHVEGKENIVQTWESTMDSYPHVFMSVTVGSIEASGNTATARSYTSETIKMPDATEIKPHGQYDDILVKIDGKWLFKQRIFSALLRD